MSGLRQTIIPFIKPWDLFTTDILAFAIINRLPLLLNPDFSFVLLHYHTTIKLSGTSASVKNHRVMS